ncbi:MAG: hypothetical protein ACUVS4_10665, partial [Chloroflexaceae bacterium]
HRHRQPHGQYHRQPHLGRHAHRHRQPHGQYHPGDNQHLDRKPDVGRDAGRDSHGATLANIATRPNTATRPDTSASRNAYHACRRRPPDIGATTLGA